MFMSQTQPVPLATAFYSLAAGPPASSPSQHQIPYEGTRGLMGDLPVYGLAPSPIGLSLAGGAAEEGGAVSDWEGSASRADSRSCAGSGSGFGSPGTGPNSRRFYGIPANYDPSGSGPAFENVKGEVRQYVSSRQEKAEWMEGRDGRTAIAGASGASGASGAATFLAAAAAAGPTRTESGTGTGQGTRQGTSRSTKPGTRTTITTGEEITQNPNVPPPALKRIGSIKRKAQHRKQHSHQPYRQPYSQHRQHQPSSQSPLLHSSSALVPSPGTLSQGYSPVPAVGASDGNNDSATSARFNGSSGFSQVLPGHNLQQHQSPNHQEHLQQQVEAALDYAGPPFNSHTHSHSHSQSPSESHHHYPSHPPLHSSVTLSHPQHYLPQAPQQEQHPLQLQQERPQNHGGTQDGNHDRNQDQIHRPQHQHYSWPSPSSPSNRQQFHQLDNGQNQQNLAFTHNFDIPSPADSATSSGCTVKTAITTNTTTSATTATSATSHSLSVNPYPFTPDTHIAPTIAASGPPAYNHHSNMTGDPVPETPVQDDIDAQRTAAETYEPVGEGPLVGEKLSSNVIAAEYARSDPIYIEKTMNLPQTYSHFRSIRGDGNCGWRAIAFSYFEQLILTGDPDKLLQELTRLTSLNNYITNVGGYDFDLFEDMVQETLSLLKVVAQLSHDPPAALTLLLESFNDPGCSDAIVYHMRLLAGSWLKGNAAEFEPFFDDGGGLQHWCHVNIESPNQEIDHVGITLLTNILLKPAGFVLEIAYLDRTPGTQANVYRFPEEATGQDAATLGPVIYLLFRPNHYDILYKDSHGDSPLTPGTAGTVPASSPAPPPGAGNVQVNLVTFPHHDNFISAPLSLHDFSMVDSTELARLAGPGGPPSVTSAVSPTHDAFSVSRQTSWEMAPFPESSMPQAMPSQRQPPPPSAASAETHPHAPPQPIAPSTRANPTKTGQTIDYQLRFSSQCFHLKDAPLEPSLLSQNSFASPGFTTNMFKNSHFNKAHYNNPQFHPEEWTPDDDVLERERGSQSKKKPRLGPIH